MRRYGAHAPPTSSSPRERKLEGRDDPKQIVFAPGQRRVRAGRQERQADTMGLTPRVPVMAPTGDTIPPSCSTCSVAGMSVDEVDTLFNKKSGMKGMTGEFRHAFRMGHDPQR